MADKPPLVLVAWCQRCGRIVAGHALEGWSKGDDDDLGQLVREHADRHRVEVVAGPVQISPCVCKEEGLTDGR